VGNKGERTWTVLDAHAEKRRLKLEQALAIP
jgi:hypothetical protein